MDEPGLAKLYQPQPTIAKIGKRYYWAIYRYTRPGEMAPGDFTVIRLRDGFAPDRKNALLALADTLDDLNPSLQYRLRLEIGGKHGRRLLWAMHNVGRATYTYAACSLFACGHVISLSTAPDAYGFLYGHARIGDRTARVDVLPPAHHWRGDVVLNEPDPVQWLVMIDGEVCARLDTWDGIRPAIRAALVLGH